MKKRILFVDDAPQVLEGLKRMLYAYRGDWDMVFVNSGEEALKELAKSHFDVLITDVRMPQMNGIQLLAEVQEHYPHVVRMVLSGQADKEITLPSVALAHQYLAKPCDAATLRAAVDRAVNLRIMLDSPALKQVVLRIRSLPSLPTVYTQLIQAVQSPEASAKEVGRIIEQDLGMSAKILQLVNSAFFGVKRRITSPAEAVVYLGMETVRALALTVSVFSQFDTRQIPSFSLEALRDHATNVGALARQIAKSLGLAKSEVEDAFLGGLLHELGRLVLACNCQVEYDNAIRSAQQKGIDLKEAELEIFGTTHCRVGAYLLWLWGLPDAVTEIVAHCDQPRSQPQHIPLLAVHVADALVTDGSEKNIDMDCLTGMGLVGHLADWKQMGEALRDGSAI